MMKMTMMLALALIAAPAALAAQTDPAPRDTVPAHVPVPPGNTDPAR
jgi:hypothetical protein